MLSYVNIQLKYFLKKKKSVSEILQSNSKCERTLTLKTTKSEDFTLTSLISVSPVELFFTGESSMAP